MLQRAGADAPRRMEHERGHGRLDAVEEPGDDRNLAEADVEVVDALKALVDRPKRGLVLLVRAQQIAEH